MDQAYPNARHFFERKQHYDPTCMFSSTWFERYGRRFWAPTEDAAPKTPREALAEASDGPFDVQIPDVSVHRTDSYIRLMNDRKMRADFRDLFLTKIFNIESNRQLFGMIGKAVYDPDNTDDQSVYEHLQALLADNTGLMHTISTTWKQVKQLRHQKHELVRETAGILSHLGRLGTLVGYVSIGDNGKMVLPFRREIDLQGLSWVVHDKDPDASAAGDGAANVERGSTSPVGDFVPIDYSNLDTIRVPSACADLVTMNQGLHHLPPEQLPIFLAEVRRILRPSGIFIVREHDASEDLIPMLDLAHSVFNAVTGVSGREERSEIRAFRPVLEWRQIIESAGFIDSMLYEMEKGDPTVDEMMCFIKPPFKLDQTDAASEASRNQSQRAAGSIPSPALTVPLPMKMAMDQAPAALIDTIKGVIKSLQEGIGGLELFVSEQTKRLSNGQAFAITSVTKPLFDMLKLYLHRFAPVFENVQLKETFETSVPLEELGIILQSLLEKGESGGASPNELAVIAVIKDVQAMLTGEDASPAAAASTEADADSDDDEFQDAVGIEPGLDSTAAQSQGQHEPTPQEVEALLKQVLQVHPEMAEPNFLTSCSGLPSRAQVAILGQLSGSDSGRGIKDVSAGLCAKLDAHAFESFVQAINSVVSAGRAEPFTWDRMQRPDSAWWKLTMAMLSSSRVTFTSRGVMMASMAGLDPIIRMWEAARSMRQQELRQARLKQRQEEREGPQLARHKSAAMDSHSKQGLATALEWISDSVQTVSLLVKWNDGDGWQRLAPADEVRLVDVKEVAEATIVVEQQQPDGRQIRETHDCASFVRQLLDESRASGQKLHVAGASRNILASAGVQSTFRLGTAEMDRVLRWLHLDVEESSPQAEPRPYRFGDITRGIIAGIAGTGQAQDMKSRVTCNVRYTLNTSDDPDPDALLPHVKVLLERVQRAGQLRELHPSDGEFTWFKLSEWMQVEVLEIYAASLSHTPWYRFPYGDMLSLYWRVLAKEMGIVADKHGLKKALMSSAVVTDIVPGIFMAVLFGQLQLLALPAKASLGESYADPSEMVEQLVVLVRRF
jgi:SAM-dependent methyltransferase